MGDGNREYESDVFNTILILTDSWKMRSVKAIYDRTEVVKVIQLDNKFYFFML